MNILFDLGGPACMVAAARLVWCVCVTHMICSVCATMHKIRVAAHMRGCCEHVQARGITLCTNTHMRPVKYASLFHRISAHVPTECAHVQARCILLQRRALTRFRLHACYRHTRSCACSTRVCAGAWHFLIHSLARMLLVASVRLFHSHACATLMCVCAGTWLLFLVRARAGCVHIHIIVSSR